MQFISKLLNSITLINNSFAEINKIKNDDFNIFDILNLSSKELIHSQFIAMLINPQGSHNNRDTFLSLLLEEIGVKDFDTSNVSVKNEAYIGPLASESGGRIDLLITDQNTSKNIIIENKIYAEDQNNQLLRYRNYDKNAYLFYLTLDGKEASEESIGNLEPGDYIQISYRNHILSWLDKCKKEAVENPLLRETIIQYINLINNLTGQNRSSQMSKKIIDTVLDSSANLNSAFLISETYHHLRNQIIERYLKSILKNIALRNNLKEIIDSNSASSRYWGFSFEDTQVENLVIRFEFQSSDFKKFIYGLKYKTMNKKEIIDLGEHQKNWNFSEAWPILKDVEGIGNWNNRVFIDIYNNAEDFISILETKVIELKSILLN